MSLDHRCFNIRGQEGRYLCPACGLTSCFEAEPYNEHGGLIGTGICPCCLFEPGFDDNPAASRGAAATVPESIVQCRAVWIAEGMPWRGAPTMRPPKWNPEVQLHDLAKIFPGIA